MDNTNEKFELLTKEDLKNIFADKGLSDEALEKIAAGMSWEEWLAQDWSAPEFEYKVGEKILFGNSWEGVIIGYNYNPVGYVVRISVPQSYSGMHTTATPDRVIRRI